MAYNIVVESQYVGRLHYIAKFIWNDEILFYRYSRTSDGSLRRLADDVKAVFRDLKSIRENVQNYIRLFKTCDGEGYQYHSFSVKVDQAVSAVSLVWKQEIVLFSVSTLDEFRLELEKIISFILALYRKTDDEAWEYWKYVSMTP